MPFGEQNFYNFGPFRLDSGQRVLLRDGELIPVAPKAFDTLLALVESEGRVLEKDDLLKLVWPDSFVEEGSLAQNISILRKTLGEATDGPLYIQTIPKRGYRFLAPVTIGNGNGKNTGENAHLRDAPQREGELFAPAAETSRTANVQPKRPLSLTQKLVLAAGMVVAVGSIAVGFQHLRPRQPVPLDLSVYRYRPFAYARGNESHGVWSPDGKSIAFKEGGVFPEDQPARLMVQPFEGGAATLLVDQIDGWSDLAWSPDGSRIYFKKTDSVYSVSPAGGPPQFVVKASVASSFSLSPDSKTLAIWRAVQTPNGRLRGTVWISSPPGAEPYEYRPAPFAVPAGLAACVRFSPDGKLIYISMVTLNGNGGEIWLLPFPPGSGSPRRIFRSAPFYYPVWPSWMPDSRRMVFSATYGLPGSPAGLWLADVRNESLIKLSDGSTRQVDPALSPDGQRLLFTRVDMDSDIVELPLDGSPARKLLATGTVEYKPGWSPKGGEFAYATQRNGGDEIWLRSWPGDFERLIVSGRDFPGVTLLGTPEISPDGSRIVYSITENDPKQPHYGGLFISPRAGGKPVWLIDGAAKPSWSPDGASLTFNWVRGLATLRVGPNQRPVVIPNVVCDPPLPVWSPSGEWIACETAAGPVLVSPDGSRRHALPPLKSRVLAWSKDSHTLYGLHNEAGNWSLVAEDVSSGAIRKVADYGPDFYPYAELNYFDLGLSLSPDGKSFAVGTWKSRSNLWILEGFPNESRGVPK